MMNRAEARRRARYITAYLVETSIDAGMNLHDRTEHGTDAGAAQLEDALRAVADMIRRPLPPGYDPGIGSVPLL